MKIGSLLWASLSASACCSIVSAEKITIDIQGNHETIAKLERLTFIKKDDFEKTADFTRRLCEQTHETLGTSEKNPITIGLDPGPDGTGVRYNADNQTFVIQVLGGGNYFYAGNGLSDQFRWNISFDPHKYEGIRIAEKYGEASSTYAGKNAFGASKDVKVGFETAAALFFLPKNRDGLKIMLPSKPEDARRIEKELRVAVIARVQPPCFVSGQGHKPPTMGYAYDLTLTTVGIVAAPNPEWVLYLDSTKEILKRGRFR